MHGVEFEDAARKQVAATASLPFIHSHIAIMPDVHPGIGGSVDSIIPTIGAIVPAYVGVDIGCGMVAERTSLRAQDLPDSLRAVRDAIERIVPVGLGKHEKVPSCVDDVWSGLAPGLRAILEKDPKIGDKSSRPQLATLGGGNHFIEVVLDEEQFVWVFLHSGSRGSGNRIGTYFVQEAKEEMQRLGVGLVDRDLAYLCENTRAFDDYVEAVGWAQEYARTNRELMLERILDALRDRKIHLPSFTLSKKAVDCHNNYVAREHHFGSDVLVTRKGAVRAGEGELGLIPGSMGAKSFVVRGKGNRESFESCSHGAGRRMGRHEAKQRYTTGDLISQTAGIDCRKDAAGIDETPAAYKDVDAVMAAQSDLVDIVHTLRQVVCVKG